MAMQLAMYRFDRHAFNDGLAEGQVNGFRECQERVSKLIDEYIRDLALTDVSAEELQKIIKILADLDTKIQELFY